jgi:hypothetical protein
MPARIIRLVSVGTACFAAVLGTTPTERAAGGKCVRWTTVTVTTEYGDEREVTVCADGEGGPGSGTDGAQGVAAPGGGSGGRSRCISTPYGPPSEVRKIWESVNKGGKPDPEGPAAGSDPVHDFGNVASGSWYRVTPSSIEILYRFNCVDPTEVYSRWVTVTPTATGGVQPRVTPPDLVPLAWARAQRQLPTPVPRIAPSDLAPDGFAFVQAKTFFWVDQAAGQWENVSATASLAGLSLTVTVAPELLVVTTGDGTTLQCPGAPPPFPPAGDPDTFVGCGHVYEHSSAMAPNGRTFPVTVAIVWHATWQASNGQSGDLGTLTTTSTTRDLPVAEIQAVVTQG